MSSGASAPGVDGGEDAVVVVIAHNEMARLFRWVCMSCRGHGVWQASEMAARMDAERHLCLRGER